jgi:hypothetical protein
LQLLLPALSKVLLVGQGFHPLITIIPSDLTVREAAKPEKRRASEDDTAARPQKKIMTVCFRLVGNTALALTLSD